MKRVILCFVILMSTFGYKTYASQEPLKVLWQIKENLVPVAYSDNKLVVMNKDREFYTINAHSSKRIWKDSYEAPGNDFSSQWGFFPNFLEGEIWENKLYTLTGKDAMYLTCIGMDTGKVIWKLDIPTYYGFCPRISKKILYWRYQNNHYYIIDPNTGSVLNIIWEFQSQMTNNKIISNFGSTFNNPVYLIYRKNNIFLWYDSGLLSAYDFEINKEIWNSAKEIDSILYNYSQFDNNPTILNGKVIYWGEHVWLGLHRYIFDLKSGQLLDKKYTGWLHFCPYKDSLINFDTSNGSRYALDIDTMKEAWRKPHEYTTGNLVRINKVYNDKYYDIGIKDKKGYIYCLDPNTGEELWNYDIGTDKIIKPLYGDNSFFVSTPEDLTCYVTPDYEPPKPIILELKVGSQTMKVDDKEQQIDASSVILNSRVIIPAKYIVEPFGGTVDWDDSERKVTCLLEGKNIEMWIKKPIAKINDKETQIDPNNPKITPIILNGRTMVPVRFLAESLGCEVKWIAQSKTILITYKP